MNFAELLVELATEDERVCAVSCDFHVMVEPLERVYPERVDRKIVV